MTAYLAGLAFIRCYEHDRAAEIDPTARLTLIAMAYVAREDNPECFAAQSSIAMRAGLSRMSVHRAVLRLEKLGIIERDGIKGKTVRWKLTLLTLSGQDGTAGQGEDGQSNGVRELHKNGVRELHKNGVRELHNPSDSSDPKGGRGRKIGRFAPSPSADAAGSVDATSTSGVSKLASKASERLGMSPEVAEKWVAERMADSKVPVRNPASFIETCISNAEEDAAAKAKKLVRPPKGTGAGAPAKTASKPGKSKAKRSCPHCLRDGFKGDRGLSQHLGNCLKNAEGLRRKIKECRERLDFYADLIKQGRATESSVRQYQTNAQSEMAQAEYHLRALGGDA